MKKDPGIPTIHPLRKEIIQEVEAEKVRLEEEKQRRREAARAAARDSTSAMRKDLAELQRQAEMRARVFETAEDLQRSKSLPQVKDDSRRAFFKHFAQVVEEADVILQILDARDPMSSRSDIVEAAVAQSERRKRLVLVLNKIGIVKDSYHWS